MIDVDLCVVGAGFAGLMAALRLEQGAAGRAVERQKAAKWAQTTVAQWLGRSVRSRPAHDLLETAIAGNQGLLWVIVEGPIAAPRTLDDLSERFGDKCKSLVDCVEQNWSVERYSADALPATRSSLAGSSQAHAI